MVLLIGDWNWQGSEQAYGRALELAPRNTSVLRGVGWLMRSTGRIDEAITPFERAVEQDPLSSTAYHDLGTTYYFAGRHELAVTALRKALELAPRRSESHSQLAMALLRLGRAESALEAAQGEPYGPFALWSRAVAFHALGRTAGSDRALRELEETLAADAANQIAQVHAAQGDLDAAFAWLARAQLQNDGGLVYLRGDPLFAIARTDARWSEVLEKLGLAH